MSTAHDVEIDLHNYHIDYDTTCGDIVSLLRSACSLSANKHSFNSMSLGAIHASSNALPDDAFDMTLDLQGIPSSKKAAADNHFPLSLLSDGNYDDGHHYIRNYCDGFHDYAYHTIKLRLILALFRSAAICNLSSIDKTTNKELLYIEAEALK